MDPAKVPATGVRARCSVCGGVIVISAGTLPVAVTPSSTATVSQPGGLASMSASSRRMGAVAQHPYTPQ
ncbi:MAG: hypothetical protein ABIW79_09305 [Gemmatimonas sp.]